MRQLPSPCISKLQKTNESQVIHFCMPEKKYHILLPAVHADYILTGSCVFSLSLYIPCSYSLAKKTRSIENIKNREINLRCIPIESAGKTISRRTSTKTPCACLEPIYILLLLPLYSNPSGPLNTASEHCVGISRCIYSSGVLHCRIIGLLVRPDCPYNNGKQKVRWR
jgi:hypothetical protein